MVVLLCVSKRGTPRPRMEKRVFPMRVEGTTERWAMDWRADPCRSSGSLAPSGLTSSGFRRLDCAGGRWFSLSRAMASKKEIHRLRDMASEWPIQVRVTTANAECVNTRNLNQNRRRLGVKAVPARAPTGSSWSLPPCRCARNPRRPLSHAHVSPRRAMSATRAPDADGLKAEDRVIACPKGPAIGHAHRHH